MTRPEIAAALIGIRDGDPPEPLLRRLSEESRRAAGIAVQRLESGPESEDRARAMLDELGELAVAEIAQAPAGATAAQEIWRLRAAARAALESRRRIAEALDLLMKRRKKGGAGDLAVNTAMRLLAGTTDSAPVWDEEFYEGMSLADRDPHVEDLRNSRVWKRVMQPL
ncbi:MAG: hypothetical protein K2X35_17420 [Bryobacteraceae bacterium]|nr:hypothetical protein [Bryobacteraceae bacterium]